MLFAYLSIEGNYGELGILGKATKLGKESGKHFVGYTSGLVDAYRNLGLTSYLLSSMDLRESPVDTTNRRTLVGALAGLDKVT